MCEKLKYCARDIDPCLREVLWKLWRVGINTISSCCGHGVYPPTIVVKNHDGNYYEYYSGKEIHPVKKRYLNFYKGVWNKAERKRFYYLEGITTKNPIPYLMKEKA